MAGNEDDGIASTIGVEISFWSAWIFGTLVSTVGLISFIQHVLGIHLIPAYAQGLAAYHFVIHAFMGWLYWPFVWVAQYVSLSWLHLPLTIVVPGWWKDLAVISSVIAGVDYRANLLLANRQHAYGHKIRMDGWPENRFVAALLFAFRALTLLGFARAYAALRTIILARRTRTKMEAQDGPGIRYLFLEIRIWAFPCALLGSAIATVLFFVTNAYPV